ncbi:MAG: class I SAM-dependent methyltransferase [Verrucomicrobiia bacterium]
MSANLIIKTLQMYERRGFTVRTGLSPWHFHCNSYRNLPLSSIFADGSKLGAAGGISFVEMFFFASLCAEAQPARILVIGNAFGLSTVLLSVLNPNAQVVTLDAGVEGIDNSEGNRLTERIAREEDLNLKVVLGFSPQAVPDTVETHLAGKADFFFIDGLHTEAQQALDFEACWKCGGNQAIYVFHDVLNFKMKAGFDRIVREHPDLRSAILWRTVSGMGILYPRTLKSSAINVINLFTEPEELIAKTRREINVERFMALSGAASLRRVLPERFVRYLRRLLYG